ncbi:Membrane protein involved in ER to Golgi transport [Phaffia rhodozyma]|uniref:Protein transport protein SFT2 n=1 Tax=Phaffia rhodozyma TaxID=264483 RepID=A0A0F7SUW5_PHARH|nr:Membrane protein involved in ER to Golgi transport [Phaffia rhodozyma]
MSGWLNLDTGRLGSGGTGGIDLNLTPEKSAFEFMGLTWTQRLMGFGACLGLGFVVSLIGAVLLFIGSTISFAFLYAVGCIISLIGTGFLVGFLKQFKMMFAPVRLVATAIFLGSLVMCFIAAFVLGNAVLCIVFVIISYLAFAWYSLSYVPYARSLVKNAVSKFVG